MKKPKIKVCGLTDLKNINDVVDLHADYVGFIFWEKSIRKMKLSSLKLDNQRVKKVGVFVDAHAEFISKKSEAFQLDFIQLHGNETADFCKKLKQQPMKIIKAFSIDENFKFDSLNAYEQQVDYFLFDTKGKLPGGNGLTFDWHILEKYTLDKPYFLSGGIGINHLNEMKTFLQTTTAKHCEVIDINSQFETSAGIKNINLLKQFIDELHSR